MRWFDECVSSVPAVWDVRTTLRGITESDERALGPLPDDAVPVFRAAQYLDSQLGQMLDSADAALEGDADDGSLERKVQDAELMQYRVRALRMVVAAFVADHFKIVKTRFQVRTAFDGALTVVVPREERDETGAFQPLGFILMVRPIPDSAGPES